MHVCVQYCSGVDLKEAMICVDHFRMGQQCLHSVKTTWLASSCKQHTCDILIKILIFSSVLPHTRDTLLHIRTY
eukprot:m.65160 g.65160  ORF g.65160 m.65160 type:complete len:74 (+) comp8269_c0_seq1:3677-3898(+)